MDQVFLATKTMLGENFRVLLEEDIAFGTMLFRLKVHSVTTGWNISVGSIELLQRLQI